MSSHIKYARDNNVNMMTFDCEEELYKIKLHHPYSQLLLRIAVDDSNSLCKFNKKFGCPLKQVEELLNIAKLLDLKIVGFSFHVGSGCFSANSFYTAIEDCKKSKEIANKMGININIIDIGGGFPGGNTYVKLTFEEIAIKVNEAINDFFKKEADNNQIIFICEPGRFFSEKTHTLVLNVIGKKKIIENEEPIIIYYLNDGIYGSFNCIYFDNKTPILQPFNNRDGILHKSRLFGPTCDSIDIITEATMLPELKIGDCIYAEDFGAYTSASSSCFNGFKTNICKYIFKKLED
jgi:ornithine decarboxylase